MNALLTRKEAKTAFEAIEPLFADFLNRSCKLTFGPHTFITTPEKVFLATQAQVAHKPDKLPKPDGSGEYTPYIFILATTTGETLEFVLEKTTVRRQTNTLKLDTIDTLVTLTL